ncbi:MAG: DUF2779 domain-containing protein [Spirochaetia bacterium]|nr:DUF2779 domain-containing protein [Spirochaetia bacterium]
MYTLSDTDKENIRKKYYISKSDYKLARGCPVKLYYKKKDYPSAAGDDDYMKLLADCGYIVGKMAQLYYDEGSEINTGGDLVAGAEETIRLLEKEKVTLFEPVLYWSNTLIRADVFVKNKDSIDIIEVKSKGFKSEIAENGNFIIDKSMFRKARGGFDLGWLEYLLDIAYQTYVVKQIFPDFRVRSFLMMPDKAKTTLLDSLVSLFPMTKTPSPSGKHTQIEVEFKGNQKDIQKDNLLTLVNVTDEAAELENTVNDELFKFQEIVRNGFKKLPVEKGKICKKCEYAVTDSSALNGYKECWGIKPVSDKGIAKEHIFDLYQAGRIKTENGFLIEELLRQGKETIYDVPEKYFKGKYGERQKVQIEYTRKNQEWFSNELRGIIDSWDYPLQFIDFETSRIAVPYHKGMNPYENIAFQYSLHSIEKPGASLVHKEWINIEDSYPNFKFAESLKNNLNEKGTIFMWATHENTVLRDVYNQMEKYNTKNKDLNQWLYQIVKFDSEDTGKLVDMNKLCREHYFHPAMGGRTSLKVVLPAIWNNSSKLHKLDWFRSYYKSENGRVMNPYDTLEKIQIYEEYEVVNEGGGAMMAYQEMMYGQSSNDKKQKDAWKELLLQYCKLDTIAMIIVYKHWLDNAP